MAGWAVSIVITRIDIADIDEFQTFLDAYPFCLFERLDRSRRNVCKFGEWEESGDVPRRELAEVLMNPSGDRPQILWAVIPCGDNIGDCLDVQIPFIFRQLSHIENTLYVLDIDQTSIEFVGEALQIHAIHVQIRSDHVQSFGGDIAIGDIYGSKSVCLCQFGAVEGILKPDRRLIVGPGYALASILERELHGLLRTHLTPGISRNLRTISERNFPILTEGTPEIASKSSERETLRTGKIVVHRFLLDRISGHRGDDTIYRGVDYPAPVHPGEAQPYLAIRDITPPLADVALRPIVGKLVE